MSQLNTLLPNVANVRYFNDVIDFGLYLLGVPGYPLLTQHAAYCMDNEGKMLKNKRGTRGNNAVKNPFLGCGLYKYAITQMTVSFDYYKKVEKRDGELGATEGNWIQAVIVGNRITPLATHKADVVTRLKDGIDPNSDDAKLIANQVAVLDDNGNVQFKSDNPRLYLRYEIIRHGTAEDRNEKTMRSRSCYRKADGSFVCKADLKDYLPERKPRLDQTDYQLTSLENVVELRFNGEIWRRRTSNDDVAAIIAAAEAAEVAEAEAEAAAV